MPKMIILRGVSGSGKSTWAAQQNGTVVSRDAIRLAFFGSDGPDYYNTDKKVLRDKEESVTRIQNAAIIASLRAGQDVIVDNTNTEWKFVKELAKIANREGAEVEIKVFDVPLGRALFNAEGRARAGGREVAPEIIRKQHSRLQGTKDKTLEPAFVPTPYHGTPGKPKAFLVDIDGTLAHMKDRSPFDWKRVGEDDVDEVISDIVRTMNESLEYYIIVMSGRDGSCRGETEEWLKMHDIPFDFLYMREENDMRPDNIIKAELFDAHIRDNFDVKFVLDDRNQVVDMWRKMGLACLQVAEGDF